MLFRSVDYIFVETVGVGQSEIDIVKNCDTTVMVMVPGLGDDIQAIKAGVMDIGDVFAVNKADRDGAQKTAREINAMLDFSPKAWRPPVTMAIAVKNEGIDDLLAHIMAHKSYLLSEGLLLQRRRDNAKSELIERVKDAVLSALLKDEASLERVEQLADLVAGRQEDPYTAVAKLLQGIRLKSGD